MTPSMRPPDAVGGSGPSTWNEVERLLDVALELEPERWPSFLSEECSGDPELRREVEDLLRRYPRIEGFLEAPPAEVDSGAACCSATPTGSAPDASSSPLVGRTLGTYRLVREIARGGMAEVFLAERADGQFEKRVAVKLLRAGLRTEETVRRFQAERQILAEVEHPSVARLIDGGVTEEGRPYLVTEYVEGVPVDRYCDEHRLSVRQRIALFLEVAEAVQHAHRNLVVHRDLKPSNILVAADRRVKLVDFGIAKLLTDEAAASGDPLTRPGHRWMTPEYAAPEQIVGDPVTTATDVYQLGTVLYRLLSGHHPFESASDTPHRLERAVVERRPAPPSASVMSPPEETRPPAERPPGGPDVSARLRATRPERLHRALSGDLDAIVLKALRKDPDHRYSSVQAMAEDLERHLKGRPVAARRETPGYRVRKFVSRHRWGVAAAALILLLVTGFAAFASVQARRIARELDRAEAALSEARDVTRALGEILEASDPWEGGIGDTAAARALLELGLRQVEGLDGRPRVQAGLLEALSGVHTSLGRLDDAEAQARRALALRKRTVGERHPEVAASLSALAEVLKRRGRLEEAEALHREALSLQVRELGPDHPQVAETLTLLAQRLPGQPLAEAQELYERALEIRRSSLGPDHPLVAASLMDLGRIARTRGKPDEAEAAYREALEIRRRSLGSRHPKVARGLVLLADLHRKFRGDGQRAEDLYRRALEIQRGAFGENHPTRLHAMGSLARLLSDRGDHAAAESLLREALEIRRRAFGPEHRSVAEGLGTLAIELRRQGRYADAERLHREELEVWKQAVGPEHRAFAGGLAGLAMVLMDQGDFVEAEALLRRAIRIWIETTSEDHFNVGLLHGSLGDLYARRGDYVEAESLYERALEIVLRQRSPSHPSARRLHGELAEVYADWGRTESAREHRLLAERN